MIVLSSRNGLDITYCMKSEIENADCLFEVCDAEFNSSAVVHSSFERATGAKSWTRYYLLHRVQDVAQRDGVFCSYHTAFIIATKLSELWFAQKEKV
jgi:hypothetical protein